MASFILSPAAEQDLLDIWEYTYETWGIEQADYYLDQLEVACQNIAAGTAFYKSWQEIHPDLISVHCQHHYLFALYNQTDKPLIIAVMHERMDFLARLKDRLVNH
ncbi:MAG: type II toxin-antitoxin system RelE/ParE family toxin [Symploca sp. SIO2G7]|nr:type II toxin-antitoxin system RelE/ParE family toxin [Symploca sp. SIO2G7]